MLEFKGHKNLKPDLGLDEAFGGGYSMLICDKNTFNAVGQVYAPTTEQCIATALVWANADQMLFLLNDLLSDKGLSEPSRKEIELLIGKATNINNF